jgi:agmatinase
MKTYAGIEKKYAGKDFAKIWLQSIAYDGTSTWGKGADKGFEAFLDASENMEIYDIETDSEVYKQGVHILPELKDFFSPEDMFNKSYQLTKDLIKSKKFLSFFGGEHSISIGIIKAFYEAFKDITILQLDAHADLRKEYLGSPYNHACALHDASRNSHLIQVGIRSMDSCEIEYLHPENCYFAQDIYNTRSWMKDSISKMNKKVYITLDLDVLDPSILPGTGTPEPGGMDWYTITSYLRKVFKEKDVVGFDIVELAPLPSDKISEFLVAKLYYKMLSYKFHGKK